MKPFLDSLETSFVQVGSLWRKQLPGFGYSPDHRSKNSWRIFNLGGLKMSLSRSRPGNEDTELQEDVMDGGQRLGNFAVAATGARDLGTQRIAHTSDHDIDCG